jgi:hypothetical protein
VDAVPKRIGLLALAAVTSLLVVGSFEPTARARVTTDGSRNPLEGGRYRAMRTLVHYLDEAAQGALDGATKEAQDGKSAPARFLPSIRSFARRADRLHQMVDAGQASGLEIAAVVDDLTRRARQVDARMRSAQALGSIYRDWDAVLDLLARMTQLLDGRDAGLPSLDGTARRSAI